MATSQIDITSDEIINIKCFLCLEDNRIREADKYCVQCKNYYCTPCTGTHKKIPTLKDHKLLDKADFRSQLGPDGSLPSLPTQRCSEHPTEVINLYCKQHDDVACALCIALTHRTCSNIKSIPEVVGNLYNKTQLAAIKQKIHKANAAMQAIKTVKQQKVKELKKDFDKEVNVVKSFRQELQSQLEKMEQETIRELKKEYDRIESCLTREINQFVSLGNKLTATHTLTLNHDCEGLAYTDKKLFISDCKKIVYIHDMNGKQLQTISTDASGKDIFQYTRHITVSAAGDRVFVADNIKGLVILDHQGKYLTILTDPTVSGTQGACTDDRNLFVCGWGSANIVQIGQDYKLLGEIGKVNSPMSLCFDPHKTRLVVTSYRNNNITVLELQ